ncbi:MAG: DHH family phosphoesterase [Acetivibrionales bacterium]|jgi:phosphoesterase RecJ-like protein
MTLKDISNIISRSNSIALLPHISADGDALGSSLALGIALKGLNKKVCIFLEEDIPNTYTFLPCLELVKKYGEEEADGFYDTVIALDTGDLSRLAERKEIFAGGKVTINIDHHSVNSNYAEHNYVRPNHSAVGEIIYELLGLLGINIDYSIALCLYVAIATDTGGFRFSNTTAYTHSIISKLIGKGIDVADVSRKVFEETSIEKVKLTAKAANSLELLEDGKLAVAMITSAMMKDSGAKEEDCDGIVNIGRNIRGVEASVLLREVGQREVRVNLRSNNYVDVAAVARHFSGGGHKNAAGCTIESTLKEAKEKVLEEIRKNLKQ